MTSVLDARVLVLNKNYEPVNIISLKKALNKLINAKAEVVSIEDTAYVGYNFSSWIELSFLKKECGLIDGDVIGDGQASIIVPTIIRSLYYDKTHRQSIRLSRKNIFIRDKNICQFCGKKFSTDKLTLDHVIPRAQGGVNSWENLVCCCYKCNAKKGCKTPEEAKMKLLSKPIKPTLFASFCVPKNVKYKDWDKFVSDIYWETELDEN